MFKKKYLIVNGEWEFLGEVRMRIKPSIGEYLYLNGTYYEIISIIHTIESNINKTNTMVVKSNKIDK